MTTPAAGLAALALFVLVLGYWVPLRVRQRQELAESRTDDRFSAGLRILAVAARGRVPAVATAGESVDASGLMLGGGDGPPALESHPAPEGRRASVGGASVTDLPVGGVMMSAASPGRGPTAERAMAEHPMADRPTGHATRAGGAGARSAEHVAAALPNHGAAHRELLAARARRASRRLRVTLLLVAAVAATGSAAAAGLLPGWVVLAPAVLLALVLVLGRIAANAARRADARWAAERRAAQRRALQARALAAGGPPAPRNRARVTGHAVRGSSAMTQALRRVAPHEVAGADGSRATGDIARRSGGAAPEAVAVDGAAAPDAQAHEQDGAQAHGQDGAVERAPADGVRADGAPAGGVAREAVTEATRTAASSAASSSAASSSAASSSAARASAASSTGTPLGAFAGTSAGRSAGAAAGTPLGTPWEARPVPLPTYVTKPAAPRREPRPLTGATPVVSTGWTSSTWQRLDDPGETVGEANTSWSLGTPAVEVPVAPEPATDEALRAPEPRPVTETLGLPLEQILARRRAAG